MAVMQLADWQSLKKLDISMNWGDPSKMSSQLLFELESFCKEYGLLPFITSGCGGTHIEGSYHYQGLALDVMFPGVTLKELPDLLINVMRYNFTGIGMYSTWKYDGKHIGGFHLDVRPTKTKALWLRGAGDYLPMKFETIKKLFLD